MPISDRREREREARRALILSAAETVVSSRGYAAMTMDDVADAAELSKGTLYLYFQNKDALCAAVAERKLAGFIPGLERVVRAGSTGLDQIHRMMTHYVEFFEQHPQNFRFLLSWIIPSQRLDDSSPSFQAYRARVGAAYQLALESIERGKHDGSIREDVPAMVQALQIWSSLIGVLIAHFAPDVFRQRIPFPIDMSRLLSTHIHTVLRALAGPNASIATPDTES